MTPNEEARFWKAVVVVEDCWEWCNHVNRDGYGGFVAGGRTQRAHRVSYEHYVGPIPAGLNLDHLCRNKRCVKPAHLEAVTPRVNVLRGNTIVAACAAKTHCNYGHPLDGRDKGGRYCLTCKRAKNRAYSAKLAARRLADQRTA